MQRTGKGKELLVVLGNDTCRFDDWLGATEHNRAFPKIFEFHALHRLARWNPAVGQAEIREKLSCCTVRMFWLGYSGLAGSRTR